MPKLSPPVAGLQKMSAEELRAKTVEFRTRIQVALDGIEDEEERKAKRHERAKEDLKGAFSVFRWWMKK